jgi:dipeptidyl-peptidase 4
MKKISIVAIIIVTCACGAAPKEAQMISPRPSALRQPFLVDVDLEIGRLYADPPPTGQLPGNLKWSPDSKAVAFVHKKASSNGTSTNELWQHKITGGAETPLFADSEFPVADYQWCNSTDLLVTAGDDLWIVDLAGNKRRLTQTEASESHAQSAPDCTRVAFVRDYNLFVIDLDTGAERPLTEGGNALQSLGQVTWVYGEEFNTTAGFGWSPDSQRLWVYATDESQSNSSTIITDSTNNTRRQSYPRPGETNPVVRIGIVDASITKNAPVWLNTGDNLDGYLPQVNWHPDSSHIVLARLDRLQISLELLICDGTKGNCRVLLTENDPRWVNLLGSPTFIRNGAEFLWLSERNEGYAHIYRIGMDGSVQKRLTKGNWVVSSIDAVDEDESEIYFTGNPSGPQEYGLYRVSLKRGKPELVSKEPGCHRVDFSPDNSLYLDNHSSIGRAPRVEIHQQSGEQKAVIAQTNFRKYESPQVTNEIFPIQTSDGQILMSLLTRPQALKPNHKYPVLIYVYGGPHAQVVRNAFRTTFTPWRNLLASRGILVFSVDGRGSGGRGHEFETAIHRRLGEVELKDQLAGIDYLKTLPYVNKKRIGIFGWSYGGTMALNALLRTENIFKFGIAVAPVTDWRQYDSAYTERYMQRPKDNPEGYADTSLLNAVSNLKTPLLLVHGLADDNVHVENSTLLVDALVEAGKMFEVMFYPGKAHSIRGPKTRAHLFTRITRFIEEHL